MPDIKLLVMDVDGTLTDGKIYLSTEGEFMKAFNVKDGYAIKHILPEHNIIPAIITGRKSIIVQKRCEELDIKYLFQNVKDKLPVLKELVQSLNLSLENVAYIGDDVNDLECLKVCRFSACPNDAVDEVKDVCMYVSSFNGGDGAVRDIIEYISASCINLI